MNTESKCPQQIQREQRAARQQARKHSEEVGHLTRLLGGLHSNTKNATHILRQAQAMAKKLGVPLIQHGDSYQISAWLTKNLRIARPQSLQFAKEP